jgi:hypothetical protein
VGGLVAGAVGEVQPAVAAVDSVVLLDVVRGVLGRCGGQRWVVRAEDSWCMVTPPSWSASRPHGWKLHVSATPLSAPLVLARAAEVLARQGCAFKFGTDIARVLDLVNPWYDRGGAGKFMTVYPRDDVQFRALAAELDAVTADLAGPVILSDRPVRPGSLVHYRYGEFTADEVFTADGTFESRMTGPDGSVVKDERRAWFSPPPWAVSPFPDQPLPGEQARSGDQVPPADPPSTVQAQPQAVRLGGRFRVTGAIRHANKGGVYRATDEQDGGEVVVKQARAHVGGLLDGTDARDRLRQEARMLRLTEPLGLFPAMVALIEEDSHLFLVQESVPGVPLNQWAQDRADRGGPDVDDVLDVAQRLVSAVDSVHRAGLVLRDLKPSNVMVTPSGALRLIDAEYVVEADRERTPAHTPAFAAPEVVRSAGGRAVPVPVPEPSADLFSLGVTLFCVATGGLDPRWVRGHRGDGARWDGRERARTLSRIARDHPALAALLEPVTALTRAEPARRWTPERTEKYLTAAGAAPTRAPARARAATWLRQGELDRLVTDGLSRLRASMTPGEPALWPPARRSERADACDLFRGAAGGLATLTRAARSSDDPALWEAVGQAADWIDRRLFDVPRLLPGLAFGRAGTAWALHDAARLLDDAGLAGRAVDLALELPTRHPSPDVTHGLSGAGTVLLHLWHATHDPRLLRRALACADSVLDAACLEGADWLWPTPASADSALAGFNSYGFAHGVAGAGLFLLGAAQAVRHAPGTPGAGVHPGASDGAADGALYMEAALGAADTLVRAARVHGGAAGWPTTVGGPFNPDAGQWCTGPAGIGTFLIRMWAATGEPRFADLAEQCAPTPYSRWDTTPGLCCGLAGTGHFLLDLAEHTGRTGYRTQAEDVAAVLHALRHRGGALPAAGRAGRDHAYGHGDAGTLGFLLRLRDGGTGPWTDAATGAL